MKLRAIALSGFLFVLTVAANAQTTRADLPAPDNFLGIATFPLWEGDAPGALGKEQADVPTLTLFRTWPGSENGAAVIIAPGGGYLGLAANLEGRQVADWFTSRGVTAFVLKYRLGQKYQYPIPLTDARRAIRLVRARAKEFGIVPNRIGMTGFSAGGHLAATAGTMFDAGQADAADAVERASSRPDFIILGYAWLNAMKPDQQGVPGYCVLMKVEPEKCKSFEQYSPDQRVSAQTPPTFLYHTTDDELVPVEASTTFYQALRKAGVPAEMHIFAKGKHGSGLGLGDAALDLWPTLLEAWLRGRGLLTPDPAVVAAAQKASAPPAPRKPGAPFSVDVSIKELLANADAKAVLIKQMGQEFLNNVPEIVHQFSLRQLSLTDLWRFGSDKLQSIESELAKVPLPR
ncbi:MAG: alpha/beta hydrolase [Blastocatellia bacterium]